MVDACREYTLPRGEKSSDPKGWIRGNTKARFGSDNQLPARFMWSGNRNWTCTQRQFTLVGQHFSRLQWIVHEFEQQGPRRQRAGNLWDAVRRFCIENECTCFCEPINGQSKITKTYFCLLIYKNCTYQWKILDWHWARKLFVYCLPSVKTTEYSSSSWWSTSRIKWSDGTLENKGWSSERFCALSTFVWWNVERYSGKFGRNKKKFQYCTDPSRQDILDLRALWGHSGRSSVDSELQDNVLIPNNFFECIYHVGCAINLHSIINSGLMLGGQHSSKRQTVFFTPVDPMNKEHRDPNKLDLEAPRLAWYHQKQWKKHQNTVCWVDIKFAQKKGFQFHETRSNAIILHGKLPACCIPKAIMMRPGEVKYEKVYASPFPPPKITFKDNWMKEVGSEVSGDGKDSQQPQPKTKNLIVRTGRLVLSVQQSGSSVQEIENVVHVTAEAPMKEQGDLFSSCVPVFVVRSDQDKDADENVDANHVRTGRLVHEQPPGLFTTVRGHRHRLQGVRLATCRSGTSIKLSSSGTREGDRGSPASTNFSSWLQKQNNTHNTFCEKSTVMIRDMGNVELFELCETIPKVQCWECIFCWNQGIVHWTCGHLLKESEASQHFHQWRLDAFSIENYVVKKKRPRGARHGRTGAQKEHFTVHKARRRCLKKNLKEILGRFLKDSTFGDSQFRIGWTEETCIAMDELAQEDHSYCPLPEEFDRYRKNWYITLHKSERSAPMKLRSASKN